jgi:hypothetical protein
MKVDDAFHGITTLISAMTPEGQIQATGFYYQRLAPADSLKGPQWRQIEKTWLVTNRHVALPRVRGKETAPSTFAFHLRRVEGVSLRWDPITLAGDEFLKRARFHENTEVDVCVIDVLDLLTDRIKNQSAGYQAWFGMHADQLPGKNNIDVEVADDAVASRAVRNRSRPSSAS